MTKFVFATLVSIIVSAQMAGAITLEEYLAQVRQKNRIYTSVDLSVEASNARREAGDVSLSPRLTATYGIATDKTVPNTTAAERKSTEYSLGLSKQFSTGTAVTLTARSGHNQYAGLYAPLSSDPTRGTDFSTSGLGITIQQSLWKDFFGNGTRLRHQREEAVNSYENLLLDLNRRRILIEAESSFWDYAIALEDVKLKQENLDRSKKLDRWTSGRVNNGISDRSDLMNVKALMSLRELQFQTSSDQLKTEEVRFRQNLDLAAGDPTPIIQASLGETRTDIRQMMQQKNMIEIEAYLASLDAKSRKLTSDELRDSLRPDLALVGAYNTSAYDPTGNNATNDISKPDYARTYVGLNFTWMFDTSAKRAQINAYEKEALAAKYTSEKKAVEGRTAWTEFLRKYTATQETVKTLEKIANYQRQRVKAEQDKFSKGRTITTNVVTAETDSAEAEVTYLRAQSGLKKLEASTLLFTTIQE